MATKTKKPTNTRTVRNKRVGKIHDVNWNRSTPLKFRSVADARTHMQANRMVLLSHESHTRGQRLHVREKDTGRLRTITIEPQKGE